MFDADSPPAGMAPRSLQGELTADEPITTAHTPPASWHLSGRLPASASGRTSSDEGGSASSLLRPSRGDAALLEDPLESVSSLTLVAASGHALLDRPIDDSPALSPPRAIEVSPRLSLRQSSPGPSEPSSRLETFRLELKESRAHAASPTEEVHGGARPASPRCVMYDAAKRKYVEGKYNEALQYFTHVGDQMTADERARYRHLQTYLDRTVRSLRLQEDGILDPSSPAGRALANFLQARMRARPVRGHLAPLDARR